MRGRAVPAGLDAWLTAVGPRCATGAAPIPVLRARVGELADLVALAG